MQSIREEVQVRDLWRDEMVEEMWKLCDCWHVSTLRRGYDAFLLLLFFFLLLFFSHFFFLFFFFSFSFVLLLFLFLVLFVLIFPPSQIKNLGQSLEAERAESFSTKEASAKARYQILQVEERRAAGRERGEGNRGGGNRGERVSGDDRGGREGIDEGIECKRGRKGADSLSTGLTAGGGEVELDLLEEHNRADDRPCTLLLLLLFASPAPAPAKSPCA
eukprot:302568-Hanusia_phi.AAC.4